MSPGVAPLASRAPGWFFGSCRSVRAGNGGVVPGAGAVGLGFRPAGVRADPASLDHGAKDLDPSAKGLDHAVLVTDAVMPAQCAPGPYMLGEVEVELLPPGDRVVLRGGTRLAGSALSMHDAIANTMRMTGIKLREAVTMATTNAARAGRVSGRQRNFAPGERADFVRFHFRNGRLEILDTWISGQRVYEAA